MRGGCLVVFSRSSTLPRRVSLFGLLLSRKCRIRFGFVFVPRRRTEEHTGGEGHCVPPCCVRREDGALRCLLPRCGQVYAAFGRVRPVEAELVVTHRKGAFHPRRAPAEIKTGASLPLIRRFGKEDVKECLGRRSVVPSMVCTTPLLHAVRATQLTIRAVNLSSSVSPLGTFIRVSCNISRGGARRRIELHLKRKGVRGKGGVVRS